jgi:hypothetical protein
VWLARRAVIDDQIGDGELLLVRLGPKAWLRTDRAARLENMPTEFGVVSLTAKLSPNGRELQVTFHPQFRKVPQRLVLHVPPIEGLAVIRFNGQPVSWDGKQPTLEIALGQ